MLVPPAAPHHSHHDRASVDAKPHSELRTVLCCQVSIQGGDGLGIVQASVHGAPGIVFMGRGVAKIDEEPIAEILGDVARVGLDDLGSGFLVGVDHGAQVFGVELAGELGGAHQVTEQHRELPAFRLELVEQAPGLARRPGCLIPLRVWGPVQTMRATLRQGVLGSVGERRLPDRW